MLKEMNVPVSVSQCGVDRTEYFNAIDSMAEKLLQTLVQQQTLAYLRRKKLFKFLNIYTNNIINTTNSGVLF